MTYVQKQSGQKTNPARCDNRACELSEGKHCALLTLFSIDMEILRIITKFERFVSINRKIIHLLQGE